MIYCLVSVILSNSKTRMVLFFTVVLGIAVLCVLAVYRQSLEPREKFRKMKFDRAVAKGTRLWNPKAGVDSIRFDACRIEKMRMRAFTLSGFDVLCLDGLVLNLPLPEEEADSGGKRDARSSSKATENKSGKRSPDRFGATDAFAGLLPRSFLQRAGIPTRSFSGIRIKGFAVNRVENRRTVPVFAADEARNRGRVLELKNCRVFEPGRTNLVGVARLMVQPVPVLFWNGGMRKLDDLFPNFNEKKGKEK